MQHSFPLHKAIQMIGTQRSGSNLLRLMLYQLPEVYAPHPPHILLVFYPLLKLYGDLNEAKNFHNLINDVCTYIELNPVKWDDADLDRSRILSMCKRNTLLELFIRINELQCLHKGKTIWCCKSLESVYFTEHFRKEKFNPFIIYLERDGRDVAASFKKVIVGEKHIYYLAQKWKTDQQLSLDYISKLKPENYIVVKYEELVSHPAHCMHDICRKLGIKYNSEVLHYYQSEESKRTAQSGRMWENVTKPVIKKNTNKFLSELSFQEVQIFESVAGDMLQKLGYKLSIPVSERVKFTPKQVREFGIENELLKKNAVESASKEDRKKRQGQKDFIEKLGRKLAMKKHV